MRERRRAPRYRCRLRCSLRAGRRSNDAIVLDVSLSGLLVQTTLTFGQGDDVVIEIEGGVRMKALAWHARIMRRGNEESYVVGMMLSEVGADYEDLVARIAGKGAEARARTRPAAREAPKPAAEPEAPPRAKSPPPLPLPRRASWWRLRIKQVDGTRTRMMTLAAESKEHAISQSLAELGEGWEILEAVASAAR